MGNYVLSVTAQDATGAAVYTLVPYTIGNPLTAVTVTPSLASPQPADTPITFTAAATGGTNVQYQFWLYTPAIPAWNMLQGYSTATTCAWTPTSDGQLPALRSRAGRQWDGGEYLALVYGGVSKGMELSSPQVL